MALVSDFSHTENRRSAEITFDLLRAWQIATG